ncbi:MAG: hypothetical protein ACLTC3_13490 [Evtepia gabavorous]
MGLLQESRSTAARILSAQGLTRRRSAKPVGHRPGHRHAPGLPPALTPAWNALWRPPWPRPSA